MLVYKSNETSIVDIAERLRPRIEHLSLIPDHKVTVSIGVAGLDSGKDWELWMKTCDKYLYQAKNSGRNRVVASSV